MGTTTTSTPGQRLCVAARKAAAGAADQPPLFGEDTFSSADHPRATGVMRQPDAPQRVPRRARPKAEQPELFDNTTEARGSEVDDTAEACDAAMIPTPDRAHPSPCNTDPRPDSWFEADEFAHAVSVCHTCPFLRYCAREALELASDYHIVGVWATVDFQETDRHGRYRRRINALKKIAATGVVPPTRRILPSPAEPYAISA